MTDQIPIHIPVDQDHNPNTGKNRSEAQLTHDIQTNILLKQILVELRIMNLHNQTITDEEFTYEDIRNEWQL